VEADAAFEGGREDWGEGADVYAEICTFSTLASRRLKGVGLDVQGVK
jgi:hypothetical protein